MFRGRVGRPSTMPACLSAFISPSVVEKLEEGVVIFVDLHQIVLCQEFHEFQSYGMVVDGQIRILRPPAPTTATATPAPVSHGGGAIQIVP